MSFNFSSSSSEIGGINGIDKLHKMTDHELLVFEDELLLKREMTPGISIRITSGRGVIFFMTVVYWGLLFLIYVKWRADNGKNESYSILEIIPPFVFLFVAVFLSDLTWKKSGMWTRTVIRNIFHYWPVVLAIFTLYLTSK